jgi:hypothetical protein
MIGIAVGNNLGTIGGEQQISLASIFAGSEDGFAIRHDHTFSDTAMTTAAVDTDPVAAWEDQSGKGNHITITDVAERGILSGSQVGFDSVDDYINSTFGLTENEVTIVLRAQLATFWAFALSSNYRWSANGFGEWWGGEAGGKFSPDIDPSTQVTTLSYRYDGTTMYFEQNEFTPQTALPDEGIDQLNESPPSGFGFPGVNVQSRSGASTTSVLSGAVVINRFCSDEELAFLKSWVAS